MIVTSEEIFIRIKSKMVFKLEIALIGLEKILFGEIQERHIINRGNNIFKAVISYYLILSHLKIVSDSPFVKHLELLF